MVRCRAKRYRPPQFQLNVALDRSVTSLCFLCADNKYPKHSDAFGGLPEPETSLAYTFKGLTPCIGKYHSLTSQDPLPYSLLEELYHRHLSEYELGIFLFLSQLMHTPPAFSLSIFLNCSLLPFNFLLQDLQWSGRIHIHLMP